MLRLSGVSKTFFPGTSGALAALRDVTLAIPTGVFLQVIGSNGAGKSTLLRVIAGLVTPEAGRIEIDGHDVTRESDFRRARTIGRIAQDPNESTCGAMSVAENLAMAARRGAARRLRLAVTAATRREFAERLRPLGLGLESRLEAPANTLSGGQRQALAVLMATLGRPKLLLLDEHLANLDPGASERVMQITASLVAEHRLTTLMVTHDMRHAIRWGDRLILMHAGRVVDDVDGAEKESLTIAGVLRRFASATGDALAVDRMLLG